MIQIGEQFIRDSWKQRTVSLSLQVSVESLTWYIDVEQDTVRDGEGLD